MNKYKHHHNILKLLSENWLSKYVNKDDSINQEPRSHLMSVLDISNKLKLPEEKVNLDINDLHDLKLVTYEYVDKKYLPTTRGIVKSNSEYFKYKHNEYCKEYINKKISFYVSLTAILSFFISSFYQYSDKLDQCLITKKLETTNKELENVKMSLNQMTLHNNKTHQTLQDSLKIYKTYI